MGARLACHFDESTQQHQWVQSMPHHIIRHETQALATCVLGRGGNDLSRNVLVAVEVVGSDGS